MGYDYRYQENQLRNILKMMTALRICCSHVLLQNEPYRFSLKNVTHTSVVPSLRGWGRRRIITQRLHV